MITLSASPAQNNNAWSQTGNTTESAHHDAITSRSAKPGVNGWTIVVDRDKATGPRLKYFAQPASVEYWTQLWEEISPQQPYNRQLRGHLPHHLRWTFSKWVKPAARVLEAGCGLGHFTVATHALGFHAEGLDWSAKTISRLRQLFPHIPWHVGDVRKFEFDDEVFDCVFSPGVCEHFEEGPSDILAETRRILRVGGIAVISTPCFNPWLQSRPNLFPARAMTSQFYQYAFTPQGMSQLLKHLGFEIVQVRLFASLATMVEFADWRVPSLLEKAVAVLMDLGPISRHLGSNCVWVARRAR